MGAYDCDCINNLEYDRRERKQKEQSRSTAQSTARSTAQSTDLIDRQQAIDALDTAIEHYDGIAEECRKKADIERNDYMDMRDDAYEARQLAQWLNELKYLREKIEKLTAQPVATDTISRQVAIDALDVLCQEHRYRIPGKRETYSEYNEAWQDALDRAEELIFNLPPAQPERAEGEWIVHLYKVGVSRYECDACHARCDIIYPYCPYCGEKKEGERDATN